ncbi:MAG: aldo/keto reductase [Sphingomonas sp.]|uniref:aldo/keto reductase n=1 Tax=Sphingomonas sp. TaxID=28214 RepID=UPI003F7E2A5B
MTQPLLTLNDGSTIPQIGLGTYQAPADETAKMVETAIGVGYRHIDTAMIYRNEAGVGDGVRASGLAREQLYVTTKVWNTDQGYDETLAACGASLDRLKLDYVDLYLVHWPVPALDLYVDSWRALVRLRQEGRVRAIGVSNFNVEHLDRVIAETGVVPVVNQIECHPAFQQVAARAANAQRNVAVQSWSPLGQGELLGDPVLQSLARKHERTAAQIILRWHVQNGLIVIPKTMNAGRMRENFEIFDFALDQDDLAAIAALDRADGRMGPDPLTFR